MDRIVVNRLTEFETADLIAAVEEFFGSRLSESHLTRFLSNPSNYVIAARVGGEFAGLVLAYRLDRIKDTGFKIFLYEIEVLERFRRHGVGSALIDELLEIAKNEGAIRVFGLTNRSFAGAVDFYIASGAEIHGEVEVLFTFPV